MNYELAKELKDAGFPNMTGFWKDKNSVSTGPFEGSEHFWCVPDLSELIAACGEGLDSLLRCPDGWCCLSFKSTKGFTGFDTLSPLGRTVGSTPEEAVARLWLALNSPLKEDN